MGLNYARKQQAANQIAANKERAHAANHKRAKEAFAKEEAERAKKAEEMKPVVATPVQTPKA